MMRLQDAAKAMSAAATFSEDALCGGVSTDSRRCQPNELFVALRGERFDGHAFVSEVLARGAAAAVVDKAWAAAQAPQGLPLLVVEDTRCALGALGAYWRRRFPIPIIAVVGSNGKTTVKEMIAAILAAEYGEKQRLATTGNLNNDIGVPLMLLRLNKTHRAAVIEIGMNHPGETAYLAGLIRPTVAVINNAQREHQEFMQTVAAVAAEHGAVIGALKPEGRVVINADDAHAADWRALAAERALTGFGLAAVADVCASYEPDAAGSLLHVSSPLGQAEILLSAAGEHNVRNALAAIAAAQAVGIELPACVHGLTAFRPVKGRLQVKPGLRSTTLIDDTYNANPDSMRAAIDVLAARAGRRILVMGDMGEVGAQAAEFHEEIGVYAKKRGIERLLTFGDASLAAARAFGSAARHYLELDALLEGLRLELDANTTVLVKGSRFMRMERVVEALGAPIEDKGNTHAA